MLKIKKNNLNILILSSIFIAALLLRLLLLFSNKQIIDPETCYWYQAYNISATDLITGNYYDIVFHNFLYYLFLKIWMIPSIQFIWIRLPSLLFSILQLYFLYALLKKLFNKPVAILTSLLYAFSAFQLFWSIQVRSYPMSLLFQLAYLLVFINSIKRNNILYWILLGITGFIAFSIEYQFLWTLISINLFFTAAYLFQKDFQKNRIRGWIFSNFLTLLLFSPYLKKFLEWTINYPEYSILSISEVAYKKQPSLFSFISMISLFLTNEAVEYVNYQLFFAVILIILILYGSFIIYKHSYGLLILFITYLPLLFTIIVSAIFGSIFIDYQVIISSIGILIILGYLLNYKKRLIFLILPLFLIVNLWQFHSYLKKPDWEDWPEIINFIGSKLDKNDIISFYPPYYEQSFAYYSKIYKLPENNQPEFHNIASREDIENILRVKEKRNKFCYFLLYDPPEEIGKLLLNKELIQTTTFRNSKIFCK